MDVLVEEIVAADTHDLRRRVLRDGTPSSDVVFAQDDLAGTIHLGVRRDGRLVGVSTWSRDQWRGEPAVRLRGMAVEQSLQGSGVGAALVQEGLARAWSTGVPVVWAAARDSALGFYTRLGFSADAEGYIDQTTALPHHHIWIARLDTPDQSV